MYMGRGNQLAGHFVFMWLAHHIHALDLVKA